MNIEQQRAAFEAAYIGASSLRLEDIELEYDDVQKRYLDDQAQSTWEGWQMGIAIDRQGRGEQVAWQAVDHSGYRPQLAHPAVKESLTAAEPVDIPAGWKEQFKAELYVRYCAMDNQDFPLEDYPAVALEVFEKVVGPRHPTVIRWRNDAITQCIAIAYKYCRDPESHRYLKQDLEALLTAAQQPAEPVVKESLTAAEPEDDKLNLDRLADYIADNWPDKKYSLEEVCQRLHATWPTAFMPAEPVTWPLVTWWDGAQGPAERLAESLEGYAKIKPGANRDVWAMKAAAKWIRAVLATPQPAEPVKVPSDELQGLAERAYCQYIEQMSRPECKGVEHKLENHKFGALELAAHNKASERLGRHMAFSEAVTILARYGSKS